jgi:hypothetical protein
MKLTQKLLTAALLAGSVSTLTGCPSGGGHDNVLRPGSFKAGTFECTNDKLKGTLSPVVVDWSDTERAELESAMQDGVAVLKYTCDGVQVLSACRVKGDYNYKGGSKKKKLLSMKDFGAVAANFGGTVSLPAEFSADLQSGRALNLAYVIVGSQSTTVTEITTDQLQGKGCEGATHFVNRTQLGAFAMDTSEAGKARTAVDVFAYGNANAEGSSDRSASAYDGEVAQCEGATSKDREPTEGCQALISVALIPISESKKGGSAALTGNASEESAATDVFSDSSDIFACPEGYVYTENGCEEPNAASAYLCDYDLGECKTQCGKGSLESCNRLGDLLVAQYADANEVTAWKMFKEGDVAAFKSQISGLEDKFSSACDEFLGQACFISALAVPLAEENAFAPSGDKPNVVTRYVDYAVRACENGSPLGCANAVDIYGDEYYEPTVKADANRLTELVGGACDRGDAWSCWLMGQQHRNSAGGIKEDPELMLLYSARACVGGVPEACALAGSLTQPDRSKCQALLVEMEPNMRKNFIFDKGSDPETAQDLCKATAQYGDAEVSGNLFFYLCGVEGGLSDVGCREGTFDFNLDE